MGPHTWPHMGYGAALGTQIINIINNNGVTDRTLSNTNTWGISPHEASDGGAWIHSQNGSNGNFNDGFGSDYNNVSWQSRYSYWFVK